MKTILTLSIVTAAVLGLAKAAEPKPSGAKAPAEAKSNVTAAEFSKLFSRVDMPESMRTTKLIGIEDGMAVVEVREMSPLSRKWSTKRLAIKLDELDAELRAKVEKEAAAAKAAAPAAPSEKEKPDELASRPMTPEEEKALGLTEELPRELASRAMTPEEEEKSGLAEQLRRDEEARRKEAALHLPSFKNLQPMLANIQNDQEPTVFEALPHQVFEPEQHAAELKTKETVTRRGFAFYKAPVKLSAEDVRTLNALMKHPDSFSPYLAVNGPGGYQPDFSLVWDANGQPIEVQICFGNGGEIKAWHDNVSVYCQMAESKAALKSLLKKYHKNLPQAKGGE